MRRVACYFGTFNPLHIGHVTVARSLVESGSFDKVFLVVSPQSPFKNGSEITPEQRLEMVRADVARIALDVEVCDIEYKMTAPYYTIKTLHLLRDSNPGWQIVLAMGADNIACIEKWYHWRSIVDEFEIWVYPREGYDVKRICEKYGVHLINGPKVNISSTRIRAGEMSPGI